MNNKTYRGRAQLRDLGPAGGVYEADYVVHAVVQSSPHVGGSSTMHNVSSADIRPVNGYLLKNGMYKLEQADGAELCRLYKTGVIWKVMIEKQQIKEK